MRSNNFFQAFTLLAAICSLTLLAPLGLQTADAEPRMRSIETPLEGTNIIRKQISRAGSGHIVLWCHRCKNSRIRLRVTPDSYATINGRKIQLSRYQPHERDFISGFYKKETRVLTRLKIQR